MRMIDADALDEKLQALAERYAKQGRIEVADDYNFVATVIMTAPTIEAEPVKWLPVNGYEGRYEVNEYGLIRNADGKIMRQRLKRDKYTVYKKISLWKDGAYEHLYVSRIVAEAFIPNPDGLPLVNHKDEDGTNNWAGNLEWCDKSYNASYGSSPKKLSKAHSGKVLSKDHKQKISAGLKAYYAENDAWNKGRAKMDLEESNE